MTIGTNVAAFVTAAAGATLSVANVEVDKSGAGTHFGLYASPGTIRIGQRVKISNVSNPQYGGGYFSVGQLVSGGAGAAQNVVWPDLTAEDHVSWTRVVNGGAPGIMPLSVKTPATGFAATFAAGDTSTYEYRVE